MTTLSITRALALCGTVTLTAAIHGAPFNQIPSGQRIIFSYSQTDFPADANNLELFVTITNPGPYTAVIKSFGPLTIINPATNPVTSAAIGDEDCLASPARPGVGGPIAPGRTCSMPIIFSTGSVPPLSGTGALTENPLVWYYLGNNFTPDTALTARFNLRVFSPQVGSLPGDPGPFEPTTVPEPASFLLIGSGLIGLAVIRRRASEPPLPGQGNCCGSSDRMDANSGSARGADALS